MYVHVSWRLDWSTERENAGVQAVERARALTAPLSERKRWKKLGKGQQFPKNHGIDGSTQLFIFSVMEEPCDRLPPLHHSYTSGKSSIFIYFELFLSEKAGYVPFMFVYK